MDYNGSIGARIKSLRLQHKMTLKHLSEKSGLSIGFLSQLERGLSSIAIDSLAELAAYMGTPETLTYVQEAEGRNEWKITDGETIAACLKALEQMKVGEKTDLRAADAGDTLLFTMADGSTWTLDFENGNLVRNGSCYATEGWNIVRNVLKEALAGEGMQ